MTVYAFSIDNFKRTQEEVDALMGLAKVKLSELAGHGYVSLFGEGANGRDLLHQYGVKIRFIGRRDMLPQDVLEAVDRMELMTSGNKKWVIYRGEALMRSGVLNVCSPYTARDETTTAIKNSVQEVYDGSLPLRYVHLPLCPSTLHLPITLHGSNADKQKFDPLAYLQQPRNESKYPLDNTPRKGLGEGMRKDRYLRQDFRREASK